MLKNKILIILFSIFILSFLIRSLYIQTIPLLWDEAALGYNAYSILKTSKDEYGTFFPIIFKSFGDYKPGFYVYLTIPFVYLFGLSEFSVRFPSIILGSLLPIILYFLIKEINPKAHKTAIISSLIMAINPYNIHFSRGAWEANILTFELVAAALLFFKYINFHKSKYIFYSSLIFGLSLYTYQAGKMISLFLIIILFFVNFKKINYTQIFFNFIIPLGLFTIPIIYGLLFQNNSNRLKVVSLFSYPRSSQETQTIISETNKLDYNIFHNRFIFFVRNFLTRYFNHFSPRFLIFDGDWQNPRHSAPYIGVILYPSLIFFIIGLFRSLSQPKIDKLNIFFLLWLLVAPIPSALTRDSVHAVRSMSFSIPLIYFISLGIYLFFTKFKNLILYIVFFLLYIFSFIYYSDLYLNHTTKKNPYDLLYGYKSSIKYLIENQNKFENITFTNFYGQPYIYYLFYSKYSPSIYQKQAKLTNNSIDIGNVESIDKIKFSTPSFEYIKNNPGSLGIFSQEEIYRQAIDKKPEFNQFFLLSPISNISTFYAYENP